jgi:hypothetical protein
MLPDIYLIQIMKSGASWLGHVPYIPSAQNTKGDTMDLGSTNLNLMECHQI